MPSANKILMKNYYIQMVKNLKNLCYLWENYD